MGNRIFIDQRPAWTPEAITTNAWWDAADTSTITLSGGSVVTQWDDKSGNSKDASDDGTPPTLGTSINGLQTIHFNSQYLDTGVAVFSGTVQTHTVIYVARSGTNVSGGAGNESGSTFFVNKAGAAGKSYICNRVDTDGDAQWNTGGNFGADVNWNIPLYSSENEVHISIFRNSVDDDTKTVFKNGSQFAQTGAGNSFNSAKVWLGSTPGGDIEYGEIIMIQDDINEATRQKIEGYLAWKWSLEDELPLGHPYKGSPPTA